MKKIISAALVAAMLSASAVTSFADSLSSDVSKMLSAVKERIGSTDEYDRLSNSTRTESGDTVYVFNWSKTSDDDYKSMRIEINSEGIITSYYKTSDYDFDGNPSINRPSSDEALETAKQQVKKLNPQIADKLVISKVRDTESLRGGEFSFDVQRYENGIPVFGDSGYISVSSDAKELRNFGIDYTTGVTFKKPDKTLDYDEAAKNYSEKIGMQLYYACDYGKYIAGGKTEKNAVLEYRPAKYDTYIDAVTGEAVEIKPNYGYRYSMAEDAMADTNSKGGSSGGGFTEVEIKELDTISGLKTSDELEKLIRQNSIIALTSDYKLENKSLSKVSDSERYEYSFEFIKETKDNSYWAEVTVNAQNGDILSFYMPDADSTVPSTGKDEKISYDKALGAAEAALEVLAPKHFGKDGDGAYRIYDRFNKPEDNNGYFRYVRHVNDIPYYENSINVSVNMISGKVYSYNIDYDDIEFPSADGVVSADEAANAMLKQNDYKVWYMPVYDKNTVTEMKPVYASENGSDIVDAVTGKVKYAREDNKIAEYTDIDGHYAENAIKTLAKYSVGFEGDTFRPDEAITQKDFIALIDAVFIYNAPVILNKEYDYTNAYRAAKNNGILNDDEYSPDGEVTRQLASVMLIRAMGFEDVAKLEGIFVPQFTDVAEKCGYTSILSAMGIVGGDEYGRFNPQTVLTRADAAIMLYNYLSR